MDIKFLIQSTYRKHHPNHLDIEIDGDVSGSVGLPEAT